MVRYLGDLLGGLPGFRPTDNRTEALTKSGYASALGGSNTVRGKTNLLDPDPTFYDDAGAYEGETTANLRIGGFGSGMGEPFRTPVRPDYLQQASGMAALDTARLAPVTPGPAAHGTAGWMPPGERGGGPGVPPPMGRPAAPGGTAPPVGPPGAGPGMAQAPAGPQPGGQPMPPSGAPPPPRPNYLPAKSGGGFGDWLAAPIMNQAPGSGGTSRLMAIGQLLSGVGAGMAQGGLGGGIQGLNRAAAGIRQGEQGRIENEEERQYRRLEMDLKRRALEQKVAPQTHVIGAGGALVGPGGEELYRAKPSQKDATTAEAALLDPDTPPEIKAQAQELLRLKDQPSAAEQRRLELSEQRDRRAEEAARRAEQAGNRAAAASIRQENAAQRKEEQDLAAAGVGLRKEYNASPEVKAYRSVLPAINSAIESASRNDRISDIDLVFALGKTFDPNSVVRESEQGMILDAQGVPDWVQGAINGLTGEAKLQPAVRKQILSTLKSRAKGLRKAAEQQHSQYTGYARDSRLDPGRVIPGLEELPDLPDAPGMTPATADEHGTVQLGDLPVMASPEEARKLPPGSKFKTPDGRILEVPRD